MANLTNDYSGEVAGVETEYNIQQTIDFLSQYNPYFTPLANDEWARGLVETYVTNPERGLNWLNSQLVGDPRGQALLLQTKDIIGASGGSGVSKAQRKANIVASLQDTFSQFGIAATEDRINSLAESAVNENWDNNLLIDNILIDVDPSTVSVGNLTAAATALRETAQGFNFDLDEGTARSLALNVARGDITLEGVTEQIRQLAINANSEYAPLINVGGDVQTYETNKESIRANAERYGLTLSNERINEIAQQATLQNFSDQQLQSAMFEGIDSTYAFKQGTVTALQDAIEVSGAAYLLPVSSEKSLDMALRQMRGELDDAGIQSMFKNQAKGQFGWMTDLIDQGVTPADYFAPSKEYLAQTLEMNSGDIDLINDPVFRDMMIVNENGVTRGATLTEIAQAGRNDTRWQSTDAARSSMASVTSAVADLFGLRGF